MTDKQTESDDAMIAAVVAAVQKDDPSQVINEIVDLALDIGDARGERLMVANPPLASLREQLTQIYHAYILDMESRAVESILSAAISPNSRFPEIADDAAMMAYNRVEDLFDNVSFGGCRRFVLVGCGQLPITAIHVMEKTDIEEIYCLDISTAATSAVAQLRDRFGWNRLHPVHCNGIDFDYSGADIVYIANMVRPKNDTLNQVLRTGPKHLQLILREPYSLGCLWAERAEDSFAPQLEVRNRGPGSRYLSRDVFLAREAGAG